MSSRKPGVRPPREEDTALIDAAHQRHDPRNALSNGSATSIEPKQQASLTEPPSRRHVVIPDPVAFKYLEEDRSVTVVGQKDRLQGYELYLVEQWACSRQSPTMVLVTYTGDERHSIVVGVLAIPADEESWSNRLRIYFKAIRKNHARPKETELGELMVTNLSSFPSPLTVIPVPDGDIKRHRRIFIVNEDLKRLGCSGRSGLTLSEPTGAAKAKFCQLYKTDDKILVIDAVIELVKLCQIALALFGTLDQIYIDGLMCDLTETAITDWWAEFGAEYYNIEPTDGILGPTTVVALLGLLMGARNRLSYFGAPVQKDAFDIDATQRGISYFQKYYKLEKTRRLDRQTMHKLHTVTAKAAAGEGWGVQKAVKSTVTEIGGKRGEIVLGMVGGRDKGGIGDVETIDLERFISLASGERAKWLWRGKGKRGPPEPEKSLPDMSALFGKEDSVGQAKRMNSAPLDEEREPLHREESPAFYYAAAPGSAVSVVESPADKDAMRRGVFKNVARDARSGLGRIKDVVYSGGGLRGHYSRPSRDESSELFSPHPTSAVSSSYGGSMTSPVAGPDQGGMNRAFTWKSKPEEYSGGLRRDKDTEAVPSSIAPSLPSSDEKPPSEVRTPPRISGSAQTVSNGENKRPSRVTNTRSDMATARSSTRSSTTGESDLRGPFRDAEQFLLPAPSHLLRRHSLANSQPMNADVFSEGRWPRRLSFGDAEEAVLQWTEIIDLGEYDEDIRDHSKTGLLSERSYQSRLSASEAARSIYLSIADIRGNIEPWVDDKIQSIEELDAYYANQHDELQNTYYERAEEYRRAKQDAQDLIGEQRAHVTEALKEVEVAAAKLEYEINALVSRVQDVEDGVGQFEVQVDDIERRADELKAQLETESWLHWAVRTLTGIGTGPNITRPRRSSTSQESRHRGPKRGGRS